MLSLETFTGCPCCIFAQHQGYIQGTFMLLILHFVAVLKTQTFAYVLVENITNECCT